MKRPLPAVGHARLICPFSSCVALQPSSHWVSETRLRRMPARPWGCCDPQPRPAHHRATSDMPIWRTGVPCWPRADPRKLAPHFAPLLNNWTLLLALVTAIRKLPGGSLNPNPRAHSQQWLTANFRPVFGGFHGSFPIYREKEVQTRTLHLKEMCHETVSIYDNRASYFGKCFHCCPSTLVEHSGAGQGSF